MRADDEDTVHGAASHWPRLSAAVCAAPVREATGRRDVEVACGRAARHRAVHGRLRRAPHRPSPASAPADPGQGRRLGLVHADDGAYKPLNWMSPPCTLGSARRDEGPRASRCGPCTRQGRRAAASSPSRRCCTTPRTSSAWTPAWSRTASRRTCRAAGRPDRDPRRRLAAGPAGVPDRDRPGRHPVPGRRRRDGRGRDQAARRDRRGRAADPLPRAAEPRPHLAPVPASSPPRRSSRRPACSPRTAASAASCSTTTPCGASTTPSTASSEARGTCSGRSRPQWAGGKRPAVVADLEQQRRGMVIDRGAVPCQVLRHGVELLGE